MTIPSSISSKYQSTAMAFNIVSHGQDKIVLTLGHEEILSIDPMGGTMVIDYSTTMTIDDALKLIDQLQKHLTEMTK